MSFRILVVEDDTNTREALRKALAVPGNEVITAQDGSSALAILDDKVVDLVVSDIRMPRMDGMQLLTEIRGRFPSTHVILVTAYGKIESAVEAMKQGAFHYLTKPINLDELDQLVSRVKSQHGLEIENEYLREEFEKRYGLRSLIAESPPMRNVFEIISRIAPSRSNVLITGESGTGKELVAYSIHLQSPRAKKPFVAVHCAALAENLLESELFGHERGAFTGAVQQRKGRFEIADGGTLFLDEITEISPAIQVKLLRVLQERQFERVGGTDTLTVDIRIVAATNRDIEKAVEEGRFRDDLYYRLKVVTIPVPPLRERKEDIPLLVDSFVTQFCEENNKRKMPLAQEAMRALCEHEWKGNVRELRNVIESMVVLARGETLTVADLPREIAREPEPSNLVIPKFMPLADVERHHILKTLQDVEGNKSRAADLLGIGRRTLIRKLHEYQKNGLYKETE
ncbi:MAG TPA: sigma-54 dependent transcriptional regulator [bacterium]|nr:sigma-54 dependent transcriptional regulator [bacterium]